MAGLVGVADEHAVPDISIQSVAEVPRRHAVAAPLASMPAMLGLLAVAAMAAVLAPDAQGTDDASVARPTKAALAQAAAITGVTSVIDGDTIEIHGQRIRFNGIDAPESKQYCDDAKGFEYPCGRGAAQALDGFLAASKPVHCSFVSWDRYARFVGDCRRADGTSVASWMVAHGHALDWPRFSHGTYANQQAKAEAAKPTARDHQQPGCAELFLSAAANLPANQFVR